MNKNTEILSTLIAEDFGLKLSGKRYGKSLEHSSLVLDRDRGIFFWNAEGIVGDPLVYLTRVRNYSIDTARDYLKNFGYTGTHVYTIQANGEDVIVYPELVDIFYDLGVSKRDYFYERGLTDETIDRFQLGWYNNFNTIPIFENGTFRNFQLRKDNPKTIRAYYKGVGGLLFNSDILKITDTVFIVEGPVDAMILSQNGFPAISTTISGTILPQWFYKFVNQKIIYVVFDNDSAGVKEAKSVAKTLGVTRCKIYTFEDFEEKGYDPVDFFRDGNTREEFKNIIKERSRFIFEL
jgi:DNA primase